MAFFEQIGKRLTDAGQGVAQQTKNFTDVTRLNGMISEKERKISQLYSSLGQSYYEAHKSDSEADERRKIEEINTLFAEIAQCRESIKQIKGVVKCPNCGAEVALTAAFCNACGAKISHGAETEQTAADRTQICPNCHAPVESGNIFCNHCGTKLRDSNT